MSEVENPKENNVKLKQREANREALMMATAMVRDADFDSLFGDMANEQVQRIVR